jgi:hypothetical protein
MARKLIVTAQAADIREDGETTASFETNSPPGTEYPTLYGWQIRLTDT